jgi:hypothetical protein
MEELDLDLLAELERQPAKKSRKTKKLDRTHRTWFYDIATNRGDCTNPDCSDPRGKYPGTAMVWEHPSGEKMCRFCFLEGWLDTDEQS